MGGEARRGGAAVGTEHTHADTDTQGNASRRCSCTRPSRYLPVDRSIRRRTRTEWIPERETGKPWQRISGWADRLTQLQIPGEFSCFTSWIKGVSLTGSLINGSILIPQVQLFYRSFCSRRNNRCLIFTETQNSHSSEIIRNLLLHAETLMLLC